jgi:hypothetical protein
MHLYYSRNVILTFVRISTADAVNGENTVRAPRIRGEFNYAGDFLPTFCMSRFSGVVQKVGRREAMICSFSLISFYRCDFIEAPLHAHMQGGAGGGS